MQRALVIAASAAFSVVTGCSGDAVDCGVYQFIAPGAAAQDCGSFTRGNANYTDEAMIAAQKCVLNAIVHQQAFQLAYDANNADGQPEAGLRAGLLGTVTNGVLSITAYAGYHASDVMSSKEDMVSSRPCATVVASPSCNPVVGTPCLDCGGTDPGMIVCRG